MEQIVLGEPVRNGFAQGQFFQFENRRPLREPDHFEVSGLGQPGRGGAPGATSTLDRHANHAAGRVREGVEQVPQKRATNSGTLGSGPDQPYGVSNHLDLPLSNRKRHERYYFNVVVGSVGDRAS